MTVRPPNSVMRGAFFSVFGRWLNRLIGMVSTVVLARLLMPEDFGIVAMAFMVLGLAATFLDIGVNVALVRNPDATEAHFHSAWTLRLMQTGLVALVLLAVAPLAGSYFRDVRVTPVIMLLALNVVIGSLENIGIVSFQKNQQFDTEFRYGLINRIFSFFCTVGLSLWLRTYWALVLAGTVSALFTVLHSYRAHPMRPRIRFDKLREIFSVSQWMLVQNLGLYLDANLHKIFVGRRDDTSAMGAYSLASDLAALPSTELLQPLNRVLFPAFVAVKNDLAELKRVFLLAQGIQVMIALPAATFLALLAADVVGLLLGAKWGSAVPFVQILAISAALGAIQVSAWYVSVTLGRERDSAYLTWAQVVAFAVLILLALPQARATEIAEIRVAIPALSLAFQLWIVKRALGNLRTLEILAGLWRTGVAVAVGGAAIIAMPGLGSPAGNLVVKGAVGVALYLAVLLLSWRLVGAPEGAERYVVDRLALARDAWVRRKRG